MLITCRSLCETITRSLFVDFTLSFEFHVVRIYSQIGKNSFLSHPESNIAQSWIFAIQ